MKVQEIYYLERVKTTDYAFKEIKMSAVLSESDDAMSSINTLESMVKSQLSGKTVVNVETRTNTQATTPTKQSNSPEVTKVQPTPVTEDVPTVRTGDEGAKIEAAIAKAKELNGVANLKPTKEQLKKIATHLNLTFKSKDTNADLINAIDGDLGLIVPVSPVVEAKVLTQLDVQQALRDVAVFHKNPAKAVAVLAEFNAKAVTDLSVDHYEAIIARAKVVAS